MNGSFERGGGCAKGSDSPDIGEAVREPAAEPTGFGGGAGGTLEELYDDGVDMVYAREAKG